MKIIICGLLFLSLSGSAMAFYIGVSFGLGATEEKKENVCQTACGTIPKPVEKILPATGTKKASPISTASSVKEVATPPSKTDVGSKPAKAEKPKYLLKAEKAVKVKRSYKRDWLTLNANSMGAAGITYGARKSNWFIGSGGALVLIYSLIAERNTNSPLDQVVAVASGVGLGYLPKISSDKEDNKASNPVLLTPPPPPPAP